MKIAERRLTARIALGIALLTTIWTGVLVFHGGFDTSLAGVRVRTNDPVRPMYLAFAAILVFVWAVGEDDSDPAMAAVLAFPARTFGRMDRRAPGVILAVAVAIAGFAWGSKAAGGSDSYGYVSQADLWLSGRLDIAQPWVAQVPWPDAGQSFSPLGYHAGTVPSTIVPSYSPGLPMIMALAKLVGGQRAVFSVVPICGGIFVLATFLLGQRLAGSYAGTAAAWLLATSPAFLFMLMAPMSDMPTAAAWTVAFLCVTAGTVASSAAGGVATALAILIRPNLAPLAVLAPLWFILEARSNPSARRRHLMQAAAFLTTMLPSIVITALLNQRWYGSPLTSGYGSVEDIFSLGNVLPNLSQYAVWLSQTQTPLAFLGIAALLVPASGLWPSGGKRSTVIVLGLFVLAVWAEYSAYRTFGAWWDLRFLLPSFGFMTVGMGAALLLASHASRRRFLGSNALLVNLGLAFTVIALGARGMQFAKSGGAFAQQEWETKYPIVAAIVAERTDPNAVIVSMLHSGSLRYYGGRMTINYANLDAAWLERAASWLNSHGAHPYALLEDHEVKDFRKRFWPQGDASQIAMTPSIFYDGPSKIYLFDLAPSPGSTVATEKIVDPSPEVRCVSPVAPPVLVLK